MKAGKILTGLALVATAWSAWSQSAQNDVKSQVMALEKAAQKSHGFGSAAISPDGNLVAYSGWSETGSRVLVAPIGDPAKTLAVTARTDDKERCGEGRVAWAPDSKHVAFLSDCASDGHAQQDVFVATLSGDIANGHAKATVAQVSAAKGEVGYPTYSPDGDRIAFLYVEGATRAAGALAAMKPWSGVIGEDGIEVQRLATVDARALKPMKPEFATPASLHVYEYDWSPDSKKLAYTAANPPGEDNWWVANLYVQPLGGEPKVVFNPTKTTDAMHGLQIAVPRWSPDGKEIAFIGGLMSDQGSTGGDVWMVASSGAQAEAGAVDLTPGRTATPAWITWANDHTMFVSELRGGQSELVKMTLTGDAASGGVATSFSAPVYALAGSVGDGRLHLSISAAHNDKAFVFTASSFAHPPEVYLARTMGTMGMGFAALTQLTHANDGVAEEAGALWGKTVSVSWTNEGFHVQGWLHMPKGFDPAHPGTATKYPMIVLVHGGPAAATMSRWGVGGSLNAASFSALGYFVLEPNPRGSYGQGESFAAANRKDFGYGDLRDILKGVDTVIARYPVDGNRVGITGWSYGGFMTMFAVTQTTRFRAAVAGAGLSNWQSYYGENSIDQWMIPYFGASVYDDPAVYAKSSAINYIKNVKTPTLVVVGDRDGECPAPQSFEFWHALRDEHVTTQLVVYPNEGHGFVNPEHRLDVLVRAAAWFAKYMPAS